MDYSYQTERGKQFDIIEQSPEMEVYRNLLALQASFRVFDGNYHELIQYLEYPHEQSENQEVLIDETSRLLHNFLASAGSLVDHTRVIVNELYSDTHQFRKEYELKKSEELVKNDVQNFIKNLRNYTLHETLPIVELQNSFSENLLLNVQIDVKIIKESEHWKSREDSENYFNKLGDNIKLIDLVKKYYELIKNFYTWLTGRQHNDIHKAHLEKLQEMKKGIM